MWSTIGWVAPWLILSLILYVIVEGFFYGGWSDPDVKGAQTVLKWSFQTALLPIRLLIRSLKRKIKRRKARSTVKPVWKTVAAIREETRAKGESHV